MDSQKTGNGVPGLFPGGSGEARGDQSGDRTNYTEAPSPSPLVGYSGVRVRRMPGAGAMEFRMMRSIKAVYLHCSRSFVGFLATFSCGHSDFVPVEALQSQLVSCPECEWEQMIRELYTDIGGEG
ncbi:MAG: hypothetical protein E6R03_14365 [Hyphomicrobiaceae bacterium]|nr:MAG: hypothetical protein E6R03_14365 [Hyphomicrobiaceae bacterium]